MSIEMNNIINKLKEGDEAAFKVIYNMYFPRLFYFAKEYISSEQAEIVVQETFLVLWKKTKEITSDLNINAYLYTVLKRKCLNSLRDKKVKNKRLTTYSIEEAEVQSRINALDSLDTSNLTMSEIERIIEETMTKLPSQCRKVFYLSRFENTKNIDIANSLDISVKTVEGHITKAIKIFKVSLKDYLPIVAFIFYS
jgi:RNA polymerase sigma-70 factor (ECF subfamily)